MNRLIPAYKYQARLSLLPVLAQGLLTELRGVRVPDCVIAMPLHSSRLRERGFNQSAELARHLARALDLTLALDRVARIHPAPPQAKQNRKERQRQVRGAFAVTGEVAGLHVAVVDDVMTTGASLNELARTLKQAGARRVDCWVLARTPD
ncbi:ComF family protein [Chitinimonas sp. BJYL2]|uniref:ComF family protein n=1 Tax=Chitinimonas sp. BJYL2 TaxID=2976696 RepID=UPI0022B4976F|nr:ComF family protein [Chitinimonas sp. BJYL2]